MLKLFKIGGYLIMKFKFNIKLYFFLLTIFFFILTIFLINNTFARYITSLTTTSTVEMGKWLILVNEQTNLYEYLE